MRKTSKTIREAEVVIAQFGLGDLAYGLVTRWIDRQGEEFDANLAGLPVEFRAIVVLSGSVDNELDEKHKDAVTVLLSQVQDMAEDYVSLIGERERELGLTVGAVEVGRNMIAPRSIPQNALEKFIAEAVRFEPGSRILYKEFFDRFQAWLPISERRKWSRQKIAVSMPEKFPRETTNGNVSYILNAAWT